MRSRRVAWATVVTAGLLLVSAGSASAATPGFDFGVRVDGSTIHVTVSFEPVPSGLAWPQMEASGVLDELVGVLPADRVDSEGRPLPDASPRLLTLHRVEEGVYADSVMLSEGRWAVVAWPLVPNSELDSFVGPAGTEYVTVGGPPAWVWLGAGAVAAIFVVVFSLGLKPGSEPVRSPLL